MRPELTARPVVTLKKRREFLRVRGGARAATPSLVVEAKLRECDPQGPPHFGFTVTRQIGTAVVRNRVKRRLKTLVRQLGQHEARPGHDYVLIARAPAHDRPFADLAKDLEHTLRRVHDRVAGRPVRKKPAPTPAEKTR